MAAAGASTAEVSAFVATAQGTTAGVEAAKPTATTAPSAAPVEEKLRTKGKNAIVGNAIGLSTEMLEALEAALFGEGGGTSSSQPPHAGQELSVGSHQCMLSN